MRSFCGRGALGLAAMIALGGCELYMSTDDDDQSSLDAASFLDAPEPFVDAGVPFDALPSNPGFILPTDITRANERTGGIWQDVGPADWTCLNTPRNEPVPSQPIALSGVVRDFQSNGGVGSVAVLLLSRGNVIGTATSSNLAATRGDYRLQATQPLVGSSRVDLRLGAPGFRDTLVLDRYLGPSATATFNPMIVSDSTAQALPAFIGVTQTPGTTMVVGSIRDCRGRMVSNAAVTVSADATVPFHIGGATTFYFSAGSTSLPVRHTQSPDTNRDGLYLIVNAPAQGAPAFVQVWGFRTASDLSNGNLILLGRSPAVLQPDVVDSVETEPLRP